jgi:hypothetical protein
MINDPKLLDDFWTLVEHIVNTVLFTLGGVVWGATIMKGENERSFTAKDWGYMILLYAFEALIRWFFFRYSLSSIQSHRLEDQLA